MAGRQPRALVLHAAPKCSESARAKTAIAGINFT
jgi:hypothetical protein